MSKKVLFKTIQLSISTQFSSIWPIERSYEVLPFQAKVDLGAIANEGVLHIPQRSSVTGTLPSDCLVSKSGHSLGESYPSAEK